MIHLRYEWRRPVGWAALCLTLFFNSQSVVKDSEKDEIGKARQIKRSIVKAEDKEEIFGKYFFALLSVGK